MGGSSIRTALAIKPRRGYQLIDEVAPAGEILSVGSYKRRQRRGVVLVRPRVCMGRLPPVPGLEGGCLWACPRKYPAR